MKPLSKLLSRLRGSVQGEENLKALLELETELVEQEKVFEKQKRLFEDEISVLQEIGRMTPDEARFRLAAMEREFRQAKRESLETKVAFDSVSRSNRELKDDVTRLEKLNLKNRETLGKTKSQWLWNIESLEQQKKVLDGEVLAVGDKFKSLIAEWAETTVLMKEKSSKEKADLEEELFQELYRMLARHKNAVANEEGMLAKGLMVFIQNQIGGLKGTAQMLKERSSQILPSAPGKKLNLTRILQLSPRQIQTELDFIQQILNEKSEAIEKVQKGLADFSALVQKPELNLRKADLSQFLDEWLEANQEFLQGRNIEAQKSGSGSAAIFTDKDLLGRALTEIFLNAADAKPKGASMRLKIEQDAKGEWVGFSAEDGGPGIPAHLSEKIFFPFFTTRENHAGLGLSKALRWVSLLGGELELDRGAKNSGAKFLFKFPAYKKSSAAS